MSALPALALFWLPAFACGFPVLRGILIQQGLSEGCMAVDRMFTAGLLGRFRDLPDRRTVRLLITEKGDEAFKQATPAVWNLIEDTMSVLSADEKHTLVKLLKRVRESQLRHYPSDDMRTVSSGYEIADLPRLINRMRKYASDSIPETKG